MDVLFIFMLCIDLVFIYAFISFIFAALEKKQLQNCQAGLFLIDYYC